MSDAMLEARDLKKYFQRGSKLTTILSRDQHEAIKAVDGVSFSLEGNDSIGIIGESGCGKTTLLKTLMGLYDPTGGEILLEGRPTSEFSKRDWKEYRRRVQLIFQDPFNALDPKMSVRSSLHEPLKIHGIGDREERVRRILRKVELQPVDEYLERYPAHLSGGELQRVSIARALVLEPDVILADEPASMLDVSTQAAILNLLSELTEETGVSMIYISHDLSTVSYVCDTINVMYLGRIIESAPVSTLINDPKHPYAEALMKAIPVPDPHSNRPRTEMEGVPLEPSGIGDGCRFRDRCPERMDICEQTPKFVQVNAEDESHCAACHLYYDHTEASAQAESHQQADGVRPLDSRGGGN